MCVDLYVSCETVMDCSEIWSCGVHTKSCVASIVWCLPGSYNLYCTLRPNSDLIKFLKNDL
jgi:hypothetical protein